MALILVTPPAAIIDYDEAKEHLRLDSDDDQTYVEGLIATATAWVEKSEGWALGEQQWELRTGGYDGRAGCVAWSVRSCCWGLRLPLPPLIAVDEIRYTDSDGAPQVWDAENYVVSGIGAPGGGAVTLANGASWPSVQLGPETFTVAFTAGYGAGVDVPPQIRHAILLTVGELYARREATAVDGKSEKLPFGVDALLAPFHNYA